MVAAVAGAINATTDMRFERAVVTRDRRQETVDLLVINDAAAALTSDTAVTALATWIALEPERDYFRLHHPPSDSVAVCDKATGDRWWADKTTGAMVNLNEITPATPPWEANLAKLVRDAASRERAAA